MFLEINRLDIIYQEEVEEGNPDEWLIYLQQFSEDLILEYEDFLNTHSNVITLEYATDEDILNTQINTKNTNCLEEENQQEADEIDEEIPVSATQGLEGLSIIHIYLQQNPQ